MKIFYEWLSPPALPVYDIVKSKCVHIWVPRRGWVSDGRKLVPTFDVKTKTLARWLRDHVKKLENPKGTLFVVIREGAEDWLHVGVWHDRRWTPNLDFLRPVHEVLRAMDLKLPATIEL